MFFDNQTKNEHRRNGKKKKKKCNVWRWCYEIRKVAGSGQTIPLLFGNALPTKDIKPKKLAGKKYTIRKGANNPHRRQRQRPVHKNRPTRSLPARPLMPQLDPDPAGPVRLGNGQPERVTGRAVVEGAVAVEVG